MNTPTTTLRSRARGALAVTLLAGVLAVPALAATAQAADSIYPANQRYAPTPVPDRVTLIPTDDPAHSQRISWRSTTTTPRAQIVEAPVAFGDVMTKRLEPHIGPDFPRPDFARLGYVDGVTSTVPGDIGTGYTDRYQMVEFTGLEPNTRYSYRVGDSTNPDPSLGGSGAGNINNWSPWQDFTTAAAGLQPFSFIYYGDAQNHLASALPRVFNASLLDRPDAKLLLNAGDLINQTGTGSGDLAVQEKEWGEWYAAGGFANQTRNVMAIPGNHEYNGSDTISPFWRPQFPYPLNGPRGADGELLPAVEQSAYYFDYQGVRFIGLDSSPLENGPTQQDVLDAENRWLVDVLSDPARPKWTVVSYHHPAWNGTGTRDYATVRENWTPLFARYNVDLVLQGHDHVYNRGNRTVDDDPVNPDLSHGTVYSISVSGGKMYKLSDGRNWSDNGAHRRMAAEDVQAYQLIDVDRDTLTYQSRVSNGGFLDGYQITKPGGWDAHKDVLDLKRDPDATDPPAAPAAETDTSLTVTPMQATSGQQVTLRASVGGGAPKGAVSFFDGAAQVGSATRVIDGVAQLRTADLAVGAHALTARFSPAPGAPFTASSSAGAPLSVLPPVIKALPAPAVPAPAAVPAPVPAPAPATAKAVVSAKLASTKVRQGKRVALTVAVHGGSAAATGTVRVTDARSGLTWSGAARLRDGRVKVSSPPLSGSGVHRIAVRYSGASGLGTASASVRLQVVH
ncbi:Ig-like domain repeat protein [Conexibacter sp. CPCC 206217]|uniref:Ig-like domain repeat protein n=1 Tax=Conexibacter sp. CPCC 206217 TaxID=3064574 RepID=UPI002717DF20|nr:Ig-like domain repeat protein [Conexibacter sp. CPCC 206217]MDO8208798.1 Ig-like domain repeat protein [Conexibacter sp. CPCC 206217]